MTDESVFMLRRSNTNRVITHSTMHHKQGEERGEHMSGRPRVLLLGDSIRLGYQPIVAQLLRDRADVVGPEENCQFSLYTLATLNRWIGELGEPDIIHWNNGIHDAGHNPCRNPSQMPIELYCAVLDTIISRLKKITPSIIWATSTPVHPRRVFRGDEWSWRNEEIDRYNEAAADLMKRNSIPINDLHTVVYDNVDYYLCEDRLHLSEAGVEACAAAVVEAIKPFILSVRVGSDR